MHPESYLLYHSNVQYSLCIYSTLLFCIKQVLKCIATAFVGHPPFKHIKVVVVAKRTVEVEGHFDHIRELAMLVQRASQRPFLPFRRHFAMRGRNIRPRDRLYIVDKPCDILVFCGQWNGLASISLFPLLFSLFTFSDPSRHKHPGFPGQRKPVIPYLGAQSMICPRLK